MAKAALEVTAATETADRRDEVQGRPSVAGFLEGEEARRREMRVARPRSRSTFRSRSRLKTKSEVRDKRAWPQRDRVPYRHS